METSIGVVMVLIACLTLGLIPETEVRAQRVLAFLAGMVFAACGIATIHYCTPT